MVNSRMNLSQVSAVTFKELPVLMKVLIRVQKHFLFLKSRCMNRGPKSISIGGQHSIKKKTREVGDGFLCSNLIITPLPAKGRMVFETTLINLRVNNL